MKPYLIAAAGAACVGAGILWYNYSMSRKKVEKPVGIVVAVTGFGKFHGVEENPTEVIISALPTYLKTHPLDSRIKLDRCKTMEVGWRGAQHGHLFPFCKRVGM